MRKVISARDIEEMLRRNGRVTEIPPDAILTPSARDLLREMGNGTLPPTAALTRSTPASSVSGNGTKPGVGGSFQAAKPDFSKITAKSSPEELQAFLESEELAPHRQLMLDIGRRLWQRAYVDGNGGNMAIKIRPDIVLCTPTLVSKGFMKEEDLCLVDLEGNQLAGKRKRTSEIFMHLEIMKRQPKAVATIHAHPPHATAFAIAELEPPTCLIPELEVFVGKVPVAPYRTPGTKEMAEEVGKLADKHNTILMGNHGAVAWSHIDLEDAYFKMEILDAYCRTVWIASQLGKPLKTIPPELVKDLLQIKENLGIPDPRIGLKECELCDNDGWTLGAQCVVRHKEEQVDRNETDPEAEELVRIITDRIMSHLQGQSSS